MGIYLAILLLLFALELVYFKVADHFNIIDKPNARSSHTRIVLRGGGIIFSISLIIWMIWKMVYGEWGIVYEYLPFFCGLMLITGVSFWDDVKSLPDSVRLVTHVLAIILMFWSIGLMYWNMWWVIPLAVFFCLGATNIINFMDGINGITGGYSLAVLIPLAIENEMLKSDPNLQRIKTIHQGTEEKKKYSFHIIGYMTRRQVLLRLL